MIKTNPKNFKYILLFLAFIITITPFLYLAQYNHPSADDFCYSSKASYLGFWPTQVDHWLTWSGRYMATAILSIFPIDIGNLFAYRIFPVILFISFGISIFIFLKSLFPKASNYDICAIGFVIFFLYIFKAPNITEAFYWLSSSVTYQVASILSLFLFALILNLLREKSLTNKILLISGGSLIGIVIVGLNEVSLIYLCITLFLWIVIRFYFKRKPDWGFIIIVIITLGAAVISISAPGNYKRMSTILVEQFNLSYSISQSIQHSFWIIKSWLPWLILIVLIFWESFKRIAIQAGQKFPQVKISWWLIVFSVISLFGLVAIGYFPTFWSQGWKPPTRTINVILLIFIMGSLGVILMVLNLLMKGGKNLKRMPLLIKMAAVFLFIFYISFSINNLKSAFKDILYGIAKEFDHEMEARYSILDNCEEELCDIPLRLKNYPQTIFAYELALRRGEEISYYNSCLYDYIHKTYHPEERAPPE